MFGSQFVTFLMSNLKRQVDRFSNIDLFFVVMTHNSSADFKLVNFLLWIKGSFQNPNCETFKCSGENFPYFSYHFQSRNSVFLQIFYHSSVSWKITPLDFFRSNFTCFVHKELIKVKIQRFPDDQVKIHQMLVIFKTTFFNWNFI